MALLTVNDRQVMRALNGNLAEIISRYANQHAIDTFKGRTPFDPDSCSESPQSKASTLSDRAVLDSFSAAVQTQAAGPKQRRQTVQYNVPMMEQGDDNSGGLFPIYAGPDH